MSTNKDCSQFHEGVAIGIIIAIGVATFFGILYWAVSLSIQAANLNSFLCKTTDQAYQYYYLLKCGKE